ncbi:MAG: protein translocase subunit SecD [Alistipes sp.]|nr:protein translocase subunit SecD [Alistipes sp.]
MQSKGLIKLVAILFGLACLYQLSFTWKTRSVEKDAVEYAQSFPAEEQASKERHYLDSLENEKVYNLGLTSFTYKQCKEKEINLGLDLKGGMNVMLEIQVSDVVKALAGDSVNDAAFAAALAAADKAMAQGEGDYIETLAEAYAKESNGAALVDLFVSPDRKDIKAGMSDAEVVKILKEETDAAIAASFNILRSRIDRFGVTQPNIQRLPNSNRILVELPGVKEPERVRNLLQGTASLEFWTTYNAADVISGFYSADAKVAEQIKLENAEYAGNPLLELLNTQVAGGCIVGAAIDTDKAKIDEYLALPAVRACFPSDVVFKWGVKPDDNFGGRYLLYAIKVERNDGKAPLDGSVISDARANYAQTGGKAEVSMAMNSNGVAEWARLTGENIGKCIAIVLDGHVYSAPVVNNKIEGGNSSITGDFTIQEAEDLANVLKSGKVPAPARIIQDTVVGPSLGQESINAGLLSFLLAFLLVLIYMGLFYRTAGWISDIALIVNVFFLMGCLVSFGAVLTLPGIAGIVLTMGMAVDANVIIYERVKEELRAGKGIHAAIKDGYSNAYSAIIDGNLTTIITGIVLFIFGNGPVQGFATTLVIGILTSMFTSIFITRLIIEAIVEKRNKISFSYKWSENLLANAKFDFIGKRFVAYITSGVIILAGVISLAFHGLNLGVEFTGGRSFVVRFDKEVSAEQVREALEGKFVDGDASNVSLEVKQFDTNNQVRIVTQYKFDDTSEEATREVETILYEAVKGFYSYPITLDGFCETQTDVNGIISADKIGPAIAKDMTMGAVFSVLFALIAIALYIIFRFRRWQWAIGATVALIHDAFMIIAMFSIFYSIMPFALEVNQAFIAAILTIIGYSINDTVVIFDRIREYIGLYPKRGDKEVINTALSSTLMRTFNTSGTTLVTLLAIFIFGGETIRGFVFALIIGILVGTYSSLFIASPIAYDLRSKKQAE